MQLIFLILAILVSHVQEIQMQKLLERKLSNGYSVGTRTVEQSKLKKSFSIKLYRKQSGKAKKKKNRDQNKINHLEVGLMNPFSLI